MPARTGNGSLGNARRNQGGHDEQQQGEMNADMFRQIHQAGYAGAVLFTWQDEWFKKTWNTLFYHIPNRRAYWYNTLTNESFFGVLGMYPSKDDDILIDGDASDWDKLPKKEKQRLDMQVPGFDEIWAPHDEGYLYLMAKLTETFNPSEQAIYLGTDTLQGGNRHAPQLHGLTLDEGLETLIELSDDGAISKSLPIMIGTDDCMPKAGLPPVDPVELHGDDSGIFKPWKLVVNYLLEYPDLRFDHPFGDIQVGGLLRGSSNPYDPDFNSKAMWQTKGHVLELRIHRMLLGFKYPSSRSVINYTNPIKGKFESSQVEGIRIVPWIVSKVRSWVGRELVLTHLVIRTR